MRKRLLTMVAASALGLAGCGGSGSPAPAVGGNVITVPTVQNSGSLKSVGAIASGERACGTLEATIRTMAESQMRMQFSAYAIPLWYSSDGVVAYPALAAGATSSAASAQDGANFSRTNVQYGSVDEMAWVKNDGESLWTLSLQSAGLVLTKSALTPANAMRKVVQTVWPQTANVGGLTTGLDPEGMFLLNSGQVAAVIRGGMGYAVYWADVAVARTATATYPGPYSAVQPFTELRILDVQGSGFTTSQTWKINGRLLAARRMTDSDALILVTEAPVIWPQGMVWYPNLTGARSQADVQGMWAGALKAALDANLALIAAHPLADWLGLDTPPTAEECANYARVDAENRLALTRITTINPVSKTRKDTVVLTEGSAVYVSSQSLVLSSRRWEAFDGNAWQPAMTDLHRFSLDSMGAAAYQASGQIAGWLINRFALDEVQQGGRPVLRLAASNRNIVSAGPNFATQSYSYLATLETVGSRLKQIAASEPIAVGETLQSVRFAGDRAYLVTFRVVDPFFVYDLAQPDRLVALGDLKVPGYSTYLHPLSDKLVFGLGVDSAGWPQRVKASLFDVSNPASPVEVGKQVLGDSWSWSEALWEPHALSFYPVTAPDGTRSTWIGVPVGNEIKVLKVTDATGLSLQGGLGLGGSAYDSARRSAFAGDHVYGISREHVNSAAIATPGLGLGVLSLLP